MSRAYHKRVMTLHAPIYSLSNIGILSTQSQSVCVVQSGLELSFWISLYHSHLREFLLHTVHILRHLRKIFTPVVRTHQSSPQVSSSCESSSGHVSGKGRSPRLQIGKDDEREMSHSRLTPHQDHHRRQDSSPETLRVGVRPQIPSRPNSFLHPHPKPTW